MRRRRSSIVILSLLGAGLAIAIGLSWAWFEWSVSRRWSELTRRVDELEKRAGTRDQARVPILGVERPEDAWTHYASALNAAGPVWAGRWSRDDQILRAQAMYEAWDLEALGALAVEWDDYASIIDDLVRGARGATYGYRPVWKGGRHNAPRQSNLHRLPSLVAVRWKLDVVAGRPRDAIIVLLSLAQLARDLSHNGTEETWRDVGHAWRVFFQGVEDLLLAHALSGEDLALLEDALGRLDAQWPDPMSAAWNTLTSLGKVMIEEERRDEVMSSGSEDRGRRQARWFWSSRLRAIQTFDLAERWIREAETAGPGKAGFLLERIEEEHKAWPDPLMDLEGPLRMLQTSLGQERRARLRLLRAGVSVRRSGVVPALEDPYGDVLKSLVLADRVRVWSVSRDGQDDQGNWMFRTIDGQYRRDLVLEFFR